MEQLQLALVGCGGMAGAHVRGLEGLVQAGIDDIQVVACCDLVEDQAQQRADEIAEFQKHKPAIYTDVERMLSHVKNLDAVDICALHSQHHILAVACLEAGKHVTIEKPLAITLRAGRQILNAAVDNRCQLAVAENYRRSPQERARSWAVASGLIGQPRTFYWLEAGLRLGKWGWRNFKRDAGAGWILDGGVHFADLFRYHLGTEAQQVVARAHSFEPYRYDEPVEREGAWPVDVEDCAMALIDFDGGAVVQWTWQGSAPGQDFGKRVLYGSEGCIDWESGLWTRTGENTPNEALVEAYQNSLTEDEREQLFPCGVENPISTELKDFADAVRGQGTPEVDGLDGYRSQAICMAIFESAWFNRPVTLAEIERGDLEGYQAEIDQALGID